MAQNANKEQKIQKVYCIKLEKFNSISNFPVMMVWTFGIIYSKRKLNDIPLLTLHIFNEFTWRSVCFCNIIKLTSQIFCILLMQPIESMFNNYGAKAFPWNSYWRGNERCANFVNEFTPFKINLMNQQTEWKISSNFSTNFQFHSFNVI